MRYKEKIRPSQFILTYGPGAILEGRNGPRIILAADLGLFNDEAGIKPSDFRIDDERLSRGLLDGASIYKLPAASELPDSPYITRRFPEWGLCVRRHGPDGDYLLHYGADCPVDGCRGSGAIRFVMACRDGHLDDIQWDYGVHGGSDCPGDSKNHRARSGSAFYWHRTGGTLRDITLKCPNCDACTNFGSMYYRPHRCSGRHPHKEGPRWPPKRGGCTQPARILARQSSSLRIADTRTLLSIRPLYTSIHRILQDSNIRSAITTARKLGNEINQSTFKTIIETQMDCNFITAHTGQTLLYAAWETIQDAIKFVEKPVPKTYHELIQDEFMDLVTASKDGAPPQMLKQLRESDTNGPPPSILFEANLNHIRTARVGNADFRVMPIQKLQTVTVQTGFRREVSREDDVHPPDPVDVSFQSGGHRWYPGVKYMGEGIFLRLEQNDGWEAVPSDAASERWLEEFRDHDRDAYPDHVFRDPQGRKELHPGFVWWHTLAHALLRTLGIDSGFSSASIRERVYFELGQGGMRGGILLYATQPGNEGTMGGLIGVAPSMDAIIKKSLTACRSCSSDPLCAEKHFQRGKYNGASCYACTLNSETSCEHRNMWLDRNVLNERQP